MTPSAPRGGIRAPSSLASSASSLVAQASGPSRRTAAGRAGGDAGRGGRLRVRGRARRPDSDFSCVILLVPRDHFVPAGGPTIDVTFGLLPASSGTSQGVFVTATGGPGASGLAVADSYTSALDPEIPEKLRHRPSSTSAASAARSRSRPACGARVLCVSPCADDQSGEARAFAEAAETFSADCVGEIGVEPGVLPFFWTREAVEDLERHPVLARGGHASISTARAMGPSSCRPCRPTRPGRGPPPRRAG